ncbi:alanine racemase [Bittarella massiliensis]|uniref:Alanine racemase n=1 Tax=Bittarella massiliensis (ex Durand et al. 2017) TaxID=1720313 RepID=A0ABW9WZB9_9FIRM|nr:alanine racemase [Clostridium sp. ATCC 29733]MZL70513.1 alanine racemase [Bittarella massiliensis (ex Durand et al. 2017)]MZL80263.1 alanine racemase [Bittarella massiliensis (ex Durand et al. 2017)]
MGEDAVKRQIKRTWAEIDLDAIEENYRAIRSLLGPQTKLMAVVKADAYGHGDAETAAALQSQGADWFAVSTLTEAISLREGGIHRPILILGFTPVECVGDLVRHRIAQTVFSLDYARELEQALAGGEERLDIHIKVDSGMSRLGFFGPQAVEEIAQVTALPHLRAEGIFTHFSVADEEGTAPEEHTRLQYRRFMEVVEALEGRGIAFPLRHCCNSAGTLNWPAFHLDMVRPGIILYGIAPCKNERIPLRPAMRLKTVVTLVKTVAPGEFVSYGNTYETQRPTRIATLAVGYADGYQRALSSKGSVVLHGQVAPVLGRVCMDQMMVDVSHIPGVCRGDEAILFGAEEDGLTAAQLAETCGTIPYELTCILGRRVQRIYLRGGQVVDVLDYIC